MQIHELTRKKNTQVDEAISDLGTGAAKVVNTVRDIGGAIASPFKDIAQGYKSTRQDQKVGAMADRAFRIWQNYVAQLEQSVAKGPAPAATNPKDSPPSTGNATADATKDATAKTAPATNAAPTGAQKGQEVTLSKGDKYRFAGQQWVEVDPTTGAETGGAALPAGFQKSLTDLAAKQATTPAATAKTPPAATAKTPPAATAATPPAKPNYGAQTGAGAKVTYNQPTKVSSPNPTQPANAVGANTPGVTVTTPGTVASTAPGQTITIGGQKLKPGTPEYEKLANAPIKETNRNALKELQAPAAAVSPALAAFRDRTDGKYESYLRAFVQKNLLAGMGSRELVNSAEIDQAIKEISKPENADPAKQRPLWNDLVRAAALAAPAARSLNDRTGKGTAPGDQKPGTGSVAGDQKPGEEKPGEEKAAAPTMTKDQISQWISRNSEDQAALSALLAAINSAGKA
jgi:hypothetical protein